MIVAMHSPLPCNDGCGVLLSTLSYLTASGIGLFFMISGATLLPVKDSMCVFMKRRMLKVAVPTAVWTLFYIFCNICIKGQPLSLREVLSIPFSAQGNPVLWFIYTLLGLYILAPILSKWLCGASRRELEFYLFLWGVSLLYPLLRMIIDVNSSETGILYYFSGYAGYFVLGYYLKTYPTAISLRYVLLAMTVAIAVPVVCKVFSFDVEFYSMFWYLSVFVAIQCVFWWKLICKLTDTFRIRQSPTFVILLSQLTFGIYLIHIFIMRYLLWKWDFLLCITPHWVQTLVTFMLTFTCSLLISYLISLLPFAKHIIGYRRPYIK